MNTTTRTAALGLSVLAALGLATGGAVAASAATAPTTVATAAATDSDLADTLAYVREEERMARDLYAAIADTYDDARPFSTITRSEDRHFDAVGVLLDRYGIDDPSEGLAAGTYADEDLQAVYDDLLAQAEASLSAAYGVGITVEETDIADLEDAIAADYPADVDTVFTHLLNGSESHLAAFTAADDGTYAAGTGMNGTAGGYGQGQGMGMAARGAGNGQGAGIAARDGSCLLDD